MGEKINKEVDYRFKLLYALGIILIVSGHCEGGGTTFLLYEWFPPYSYHVGLFVFVSGYFYRIGSENMLLRYIWKKIRNLLIPLYLWNLFYAIIVLILSEAGFTIGTPVTFSALLLEPLLHGHQFDYNLGSWFVFPLFMVQTGCAVVRKIFRVLKLDLGEWVYFLLFCSIGVAGVWLAGKGYYTGIWLVFARMAYFIPFYALGTLYRTKLEKYDNKVSTPVYLAIVFLTNIVIVYHFGYVPSYTPAWCNDFTEGPITPFVVGFMGIFFWMRIARILEPLIGRNKAVNLVADNTYSIMVNHYAGFMVVKTFYAFLCKFTPWFQNFNMASYKSDVNYFYFDRDIWQLGILYLLAGIIIPILMQQTIRYIRVYLQQNWLSRRRAV